MNFRHNTGEPMGPSVAYELRNAKLSNSKRAVYLRERNLTMTDEQRERERQIQKKSKAKAKANKCIAKASGRYFVTRKNSYLEGRIRHHLSKGRDVADIAIREFILVSKVEGIIAQIKGVEVAK